MRRNILRDRLPFYVLNAAGLVLLMVGHDAFRVWLALQHDGGPITRELTEHLSEKWTKNCELSGQKRRQHESVPKGRATKSITGLSTPSVSHGYAMVT